MKKLMPILLCTTVLLSALPAFAQSCQLSDKSAVASCLDMNVETCRALASCNDYEQVLTTTDVRELAISTCCGKRTRTARNLCLVKERKKYTPKVASGQQRAFFRAARAEVNTVRKDVCRNSPYELDEDSALF